MSKSIYHIAYADLIKELEQTVSDLKRKGRLMQLTGSKYLDGNKRRILVNERILKLLLKSKKDFLQADLFNLNCELNKKEN